MLGIHDRAPSLRIQSNKRKYAFCQNEAILLDYEECEKITTKKSILRTNTRKPTAPHVQTNPIKGTYMTVNELREKGA